MKQIQTAWGAPGMQYTMLLHELEALANSTKLLLETYKTANMEFAYLLYEKQWINLMNRSDCLTVYEESFAKAFQAMEQQVKVLEQSKGAVQLSAITHSINHSSN